MFIVRRTVKTNPRETNKNYRVSYVMKAQVLINKCTRSLKSLAPTKYARFESQLWNCIPGCIFFVLAENLISTFYFGYVTKIFTPWIIKPSSHDTQSIKSETV